MHWQVETPIKNP